MNTQEVSPEELEMAQAAAMDVLGVESIDSEQTAEAVDNASVNIAVYVKNKLGEVSDKTLGELWSDLGQVATASMEELEELTEGDLKSLPGKLLESKNLMLLGLIGLGGYFLFKLSGTVAKVIAIGGALYLFVTYVKKK